MRIPLYGTMLLLSLTSCEMTTQEFFQPKYALSDYQARVSRVELIVCPRIDANPARVPKDKELDDYNIKLTAQQQKDLIEIYRSIEHRRAITKKRSMLIHDSYGAIASLHFYDANNTELDSIYQGTELYSDSQKAVYDGYYLYLPHKELTRLRKIFSDAVNASRILEDPLSPQQLFITPPSPEELARGFTTVDE